MASNTNSNGVTRYPFFDNDTGAKMVIIKLDLGITGINLGTIKEQAGQFLATPYIDTAAQTSGKLCPNIVEAELYLFERAPDALDAAQDMIAREVGFIRDALLIQRKVTE